MLTGELIDAALIADVGMAKGMNKNIGNGWGKI